jgi:beta-aspartyl-peptidase (threonine type)
MSYQIIIHGGANDLLSEADKRKAQCESIVNQIEEVLKNGGNALDACEAGIKLLENDPTFNAGTGSYLQLDGKPRMDASIMDSNLNLGAVIQITNVKHPISVARKLLEKKLHSTLSAEGALLFAKEQGFETFNPAIPKQIKSYQENIEKLKGNISYDNIVTDYEVCTSDKLGTVGCVVRDDSGLIVAGTSTGGLRVCYPGRVGDSPLVGAGMYANKFAGVSCTGIGEKIMRLTLARNITFYKEQGLTLDEACDKAINELTAINGDGGVIAISKDGEITAKFNTKTMSWASRKN